VNDYMAVEMGRKLKGLRPMSPAMAEGIYRTSLLQHGLAT